MTERDSGFMIQSIPKDVGSSLSPTGNYRIVRNPYPDNYPGVYVVAIEIMEGFFEYQNLPSYIGVAGVDTRPNT